MNSPIDNVATLERSTSEPDPVTIDFTPQMQTSSSRTRHFRHRTPKSPISRETLRGLSFAVGIFFVSRLVALGAVYLGTRMIPGKNVVSALLSWDAGWYYKAITSGYPHIAIQGEGVNAQNTIAFFPLFPMMARALDWLFLSPIQAGLTISIASGATTAVLLWLFTRDITKSVRVSNLTVALFSFFPGSIAAMLMMSEGVMLTFTIACLFALRKQQWLLAGLCAALATSARPTALPLVLCCTYAAAVAIWKRRQWRSVIAPVLAPLGTLGYFLFLEHHTGSFMAWFRVEAIGWEYAKTERFAPLKTLPQLADPLIDMNRSVTAVALLLSIAGLLLLIKRKLPMELVIYTVTVFFLAFFTGGPASKIRYVWSAFPFFIAAALWAKTEFRSMTLLTTFASGMAVYTVLVVHTNLSIF